MTPLSLADPHPTCEQFQSAKTFNTQPDPDLHSPRTHVSSLSHLDHAKSLRSSFCPCPLSLLFEEQPPCSRPFHGLSPHPAHVLTVSRGPPNQTAPPAPPSLHSPPSVSMNPPGVFQARQCRAWHRLFPLPRRLFPHLLQACVPILPIGKGLPGHSV